ncbi:phosphatidate cytidylyltransferase [Oscillochloris sp. ZM17-4]|uniref:phosphatidate cytidylyltransferase n=1 Tax=Oscillochloris sp. ZM17-4 TaxID=2866714 RepID=UPI001C73928F|nr:phosphatidate cytidylyltransferase [Oscillochloris sp. ZM17-4]MBX0328541.1 phosphatidate cytidylyltransferase [Oscillochloris sp. ZM17-4]
MDGANAASADSPSRASSLALRVASVSVLIPIVVAAAWWYWSTTILVGLCIVLGVVELNGIIRRGGYTPRTPVGLAVGLLVCAATAFQPSTSLDLSGAAIGLSILISLAYELLPRDRSDSLISWALTFSGAYYIGGLLSYFILIGQLDTPLRGGWLAMLHIPPGTSWIFLVLAVTWLQDTAAYFVGRAFGRHKMAPILSPKKSWEGAAGGFVTSILSALLAVAILGLPIGYADAALIGAAAGVAGPLGDLVESLIKRQIGIKDSGQLIPGHGGILDRIDSLLFTAPVIYYLILLTLGS